MGMVVATILGAFMAVLTAFACVWLWMSRASKPKVPHVAPQVPVQRPLQEPPQAWYDMLAALQLRFNDLEGRVNSNLQESAQNYRNARAAEERTRVKIARMGDNEDEMPGMDPRQMHLMTTGDPEEEELGPHPLTAAQRKLEERRKKVSGG